MAIEMEHHKFRSVFFDLILPRTALEIMSLSYDHRKGNMCTEHMIPMRTMNRKGVA